MKAPSSQLTVRAGRTCHVVSAGAITLIVDVDQAVTEMKMTRAHVALFVDEILRTALVRWKERTGKA